MKFTTPLVLAAFLGSSDASVTQTKRSAVSCTGSNAVVCSESRLLDITVTKDECNSEEALGHLMEDEHACEADLEALQAPMGALLQTNEAAAIQQAVESLQNNERFMNDVQQIEQLQRDAGDTAQAVMESAIPSETDTTFTITVDDELVGQLDQEFGEVRREENALLDNRYWGDDRTMRSMIEDLRATQEYEDLAGAWREVASHETEARFAQEVDDAWSCLEKTVSFSDEGAREGHILSTIGQAHDDLHDFLNGEINGVLNFILNIEHH